MTLNYFDKMFEDFRDYRNSNLAKSCYFKLSMQSISDLEMEWKMTPRLYLKYSSSQFPGMLCIQKGNVDRLASIPNDSTLPHRCRMLLHYPRCVWASYKTGSLWKNKSGHFLQISSFPHWKSASSHCTQHIQNLFYNLDKL